MSTRRFETISRDQLASKLQASAPDNEARSEGFALVNVLGPEQFERERIPGSANIPQDQVESFESRYDKQKEIIVYCASPQCDASEKAAESLASRGFEHVFDYDAGMSDWRSSGHPVAGTSA